MELILERDLPHQQKAIDAICAVLEGVRIIGPTRSYESPLISLTDPRLVSNIGDVLAGLPPEYRSSTPIGDCLNLDIKMETGTGKTYVYTKVMYELHKRFGLNKFIIAVPSLAIKAGTAQFIKDEYTRRHFADVCHYGAEMEIGVLEASKSKRKGRSYFPGVVSEFVKGSHQNTRKIYVLLINMQLLSSGRMLTRNDYDYGPEGFYRPLDALRATRPVVVIDEPHRFSRDQKAYRVIAEEIKPQCILRFGATFPEVTSGRGTKKTTVRDYQNLLYDLNACEAFNQNLIKGVAKEHFEPLSKRNEKVKITSITSKDSVTLRYIRRDESPRSIILRPGDSLSIISESFEGITVRGIGTSTVIFSNGLEKSVGEELAADVYMTSYQEQMIRLALERHFETERENFCGRIFRIKTLALFFIDNISSYRPVEGKVPYLRDAFERMLKEKIESVLGTLDENDSEYRAYLEASLADLSACHAGYFSRDNSDSDEEIAKEIDAILHGKKQLLSFKKADGSPNTLRFLFSKWTLKEGWDNPNVFTIAKLRSSGSEISKLQEVGRGLRLPVDENGNRVSNEEFRLNYVVDFTEADFATRLVEEIDGQIPQALTISEASLSQVATKLGRDSDDLFDTLYRKGYIDRHLNIVTRARDQFFEEFPDFATGLLSGKVRDRNVTKTRPVRIRETAYRKIQHLWETINQRFLLFFDSDLDANMVAVVLSLLEQPGVFADSVVSSTRDIVSSTGGQMNVVSSSGVQYTVARPIAYGDFLKRITRVTNIPIAILHQAMCAYARKHGNIDAKYINENSISAICSAFQTWKIENLQGRFRYVKSNASRGATALTHSDGSPRKDIAHGRIGARIAPGTPSAKYLYDTYAYDSQLEKRNITTDIEEVVVFGKIPRNSIAIPTITGSTYSPDFMYIVKTASGATELNIVVETKDVEDKASLRGVEKAKIDCARVFFDILSKDGYTVHFRDQLNNRQMAQIINEVLGQ